MLVLHDLLVWKLPSAPWPLCQILIKAPWEPAALRVVLRDPRGREAPELSPRHSRLDITSLVGPNQGHMLATPLFRLSNHCLCDVWTRNGKWNHAHADVILPCVIVIVGIIILVAISLKYVMFLVSLNS